MFQRIVVTGLGCISAAGYNVIEFTDTIFAQDGDDIKTILQITLFDTENSATKIAAQVKNYDPTQYFKATEIKQLDRYAQFALLSTEEALNDARIIFDEALAKRTCVIHGTSIGGQETIEQAYQIFYSKVKKKAHPFTVPKLLPSAASSQISMKYGITGPAFSTSSACSSSGHAIIMATLMLRNNMIDVALAGGAEACITPGNLLAWEGLRVLSQDTCRPFSADRSGLVIGEGAGTLILETLEYAQQRGAHIYAEIIGIGMSSDAHNLVQPKSEGAEQAMEAALLDANIQADKIEYINAHGSATIQNDRTETQAIHQVFSNHASKLKVSSTKSVHGHVLGAGAAIESIATIIAMVKQQVPATKNYQEYDPECDLDYVINQPANTKLTHTMCNSFAFGGLNTSLIFKSFL